MNKLYNLLVLSILLLSTVVYAQQYTISGEVTSQTTGEKLIGANIYLEGTGIGAATDADGKYSITVNKGDYTIVCSYIGFETKKEDIKLDNNMEVNFELKDHQFTLSVTVIADRAKERETPVAFSDVEKKGIETRLGSRDIPLVLNTTPSIYATAQGGGAGDSRVNLRGFNQRNVAIMINGVPVNDMENGWVYWSNWDGIGDATSSIQIQRGLSAITLATPSIGGTINVITDPTANKYGLKFTQEFASGVFRKSTLSASTGLMDGKWAMSGTIVKKTGNGVIDGTWTDAWAYYFGASYNLNNRNRLELYALGAPQRHGQNLYAQNIAAYSHSYAKELGYTDAQLAKVPEAGRNFNENWNVVNPSYKGLQYWDGHTGSRILSNFLNERENYYDKPLVNLNWYSQLSNKLSLYTTAYYSGGIGGGSGTAGHMAWDYSFPSRVVDWNGTIAQNEKSGVAQGILRNSVNTQWTYGVISKGYYKFSDYFKGQFGVDWRTAQIQHYQEVRDLLGGNYYVDTNNEFDTPAQQQKRLGDKIAYYETNTVDWFGFYGQGEYTKDKLTAYATYGWSTIKYSFTNHFKMDANGNELVLKSKNIDGYQLKGGASYRLNYNTDLFANVGLVSKVPIFDVVIDDVTSTMAPNPKNEKFYSYEGGINFRAMEGTLSLKADYYYTVWKDRSNSINVTNLDGSTSIVFLTGMNELHTGVEFQGTYQPIQLFRLEAMASIGNWKYLDDVSGFFKDYSGGTLKETPYNYYVKDLKVGDAPQTQFSLTASVFPMTNMTVALVYKNYSSYYANWNPFSRTDPTDRGQVWDAPSYGIFDAHFRWTLPVDLGGIHLDLFAHAFNLFDKVYVQDATDNSQYNGISGAPSHSAQRAEVFLGMPRTFNVGVSLSY